MASGSRFIPLKPDEEASRPQDQGSETLSTSALVLSGAKEDWAEENRADGEVASATRRGVWAWAAPLLAIALLLGWTAVFLAANLAAMRAGADLPVWLGWVEGWSGPAMLIGLGWLLVIRTSRREARRFGDTVTMLADESTQLETRLAAMTRELSLAREFLAAQSRDLDSLGRIAVERIGQHAGQLQSLIQNNSTQIETIGTVSTSALENMELLRNQLPVITNAAKDITNNIGNAGRVAHAQLQDLVVGLTRLNEFGLACERAVETVRKQVAEALGQFDTRIAEIDHAANNRLSALDAASQALAQNISHAENTALAALEARRATLDSEVSTTRRQIEDEETQAFALLQARLVALRDEAAGVARTLRDGEARAMDDWNANVARLDEAAKTLATRIEVTGHEAVTTSQARLEALETAISQAQHKLAAMTAQAEAEAARREEAQQQRLAQLAATITATTEHMASVDTRAQALAEAITQAQAQIARRAERLAETLAASHEGITQTDTAVGTLTDNSVRLLELIRASADHTASDLPAAIAASNTKLVELEQRTSALHIALGEAGNRGQDLSAHMETTHDKLRVTTQEIATLRLTIDSATQGASTTLAALQTSLEQVDSQTTALAGRARGELTEAIARLSGAAREAVSGIETHGAGSIARIAEMLGTQSSAAIERAMHTHAAEIAGQLEAAAAHAAGVSREAAQQLRNQLAKVDELVGNLEQRVAQAREQAEEQVDDGFARRVALITEALNSAAIDITAALNSDVSDSAWAGYLRGDRGIFTRRAVKLLEAPDAKAIAQLYQGDEAFHRHVSHYIHDFEAMLRQLLATRDGHALGVTLLSSDMGKLYVALAQAIDRLRN